MTVNGIDALLQSFHPQPSNSNHCAEMVTWNSFCQSQINLFASARPSILHTLHIRRGRCFKWTALVFFCYNHAPVFTCLALKCFKWCDVMERVMITWLTLSQNFCRAVMNNPELPLDPNLQTSNLLITFLKYASIVMQDTKGEHRLSLLFDYKSLFFFSTFPFHPKCPFVSVL